MIIKQPSLVGWWEGPPFGGGSYNFGFSSPNSSDINAALQALVKVDSTNKKLVISDRLSTDSALSSESAGRAIVIPPRSEPAPIFDYWYSVSIRKDEPIMLRVILSPDRLRYENLVIPPGIEVEDRRKQPAPK